MENIALVSLYHPSGAKVSIPLSIDEMLTPAHGITLLNSVDNLIMAGFTVNLPGLEDGENFEQIGFVVRREKVNDDSTTTPVVDVYPVTGNFRTVGLYLNTQDDISAFEGATGVKVSEMPVYDGNPIERGKNPRADKNVVALKSPAKLVWKINPKWEGENDKKHSKRQFVRWEGVRASAEPVRQAMTIEQARTIKTAKGSELGSLSEKQLHQLIESTAGTITDEMRDAAKIILNGGK